MDITTQKSNIFFFFWHLGLEKGFLISPKILLWVAPPLMQSLSSSTPQRRVRSYIFGIDLCVESYIFVICSVLTAI
ncbi:unnamed protein product [Lactuca virosa]|uniref:Uncharacterized protein n=1 Tax=Lactuca virosa TaxID=75947 RepID=A0AAU9LZ93_9ASTR|nr:unnamed protein product [Lactuca virosa]